MYKSQAIRLGGYEKMYIFTEQIKIQTMELVTSAQVIGFFIWLFYITAGTFTLMFIVSIIPFWMTMATINHFNPKLAEKISTWILEF